ncbi:MAG: Rieske 2Fe-2S domain-containing protein [Methylovirgula sp.]
MSWKEVCGQGDIPENALAKFDVDGVAVLIANYGDGFRAMPPICPHMEEPLVESGVIGRCILTCTKHLWAWNLKSLDLVPPTEKPLKTYELKVEGGKLFVLIDQELVYEFDEEADDMDDDFFAKS